ncbi:MAG: condensation domain-containing protein [Coriobacteriales bacterium]|nr:condensation domain-containing protein [Coriobacteriales bacterium]
MKTYPLTAAQRMHDIWIRDYGTQQVSGVSMVAALKIPMEFDVLQRCMQMEYERNGCMRLRFTKRNRQGEVKQYFSGKKRSIGEVPLIDLSGMSSQEADDTMQHWAYQTFDGDNIAMFEFKMVKLPHGFNGFFLHMDHRLVDSQGLAVLVGDLLRLYAHEVLGTKEPPELADFSQVLERDLAKASNPRRLEKDKRFWDDQLDTLGEPLYSDIQGPSVLEESRRLHNDPTLRAADVEMTDTFVAVKDYYLEPEPTSRLMRFCEYNQLSVTNVILLLIRTYLSKVNNGQEDITIQNFISRRSTRAEMASGGSRTIMFPCRTVIPPDMEFLDAAYEIQQAQNRIYLHGNYDPELIREEMRKRYGTPPNTAYESCYLTYQPPAASYETASLKGIPFYVKWFANGAATKKMYLTVSHNSAGEMRFSYHYQTAHLVENDIELLYYYMMKILFRGINDPHVTVGDIMAQV